MYRVRVQVRNIIRWIARIGSVHCHDVHYVITDVGLSDGIGTVILPGLCDVEPVVVVGISRYVIHRIY